MTTTWQNRITGEGEESPDQLLANVKNWRIHPKHQQDALAGVLNEVGWVQRVIVNQRSGHLVDGHLRVSLALQRNEPSIPVLYVDLTEAEEALVLATIDPLSAMAATDAEKLDELLRDVATGEAAVQEMLAELAERSGVIPPDTFNAEDEWVGMPEFSNDDLTAKYKVVVNFASEDDMATFERLIGQKIPQHPRSIWFPKTERLVANGGYTSDES